MVEQQVGRARHGRRGHGADDRIGCQNDLELLGLEPAVEYRPRGARDDFDGARAVGTELQEAPAQPRQRQQVAGTERPWVGRRLEQGWLDKPRHAFEHRLVTGQGLHIALRELGDLAADELLVRAEQQVATAGEGREGRGIAWQHLVAVAVQVQVADDLGPEQAVHVRGSRDLEPGPDFFGDAGAADDVPPLEDEHRHPGPRKVARGDEAVVSGPDDDDVVRNGHAVPSDVSRGPLC